MLKASGGGARSRRKKLLIHDGANAVIHNCAPYMLGSSLSAVDSVARSPPRRAGQAQPGPAGSRGEGQIDVNVFGVE